MSEANVSFAKEVAERNAQVEAKNAIFKARVASVDSNDCIAVDPAALQEVQFAQAEAMQEALHRYVKLLAEAFQLSPSCKIMKALQKDDEEGSDDETGNPLDNA